MPLISMIHHQYMGCVVGILRMSTEGSRQFTIIIIITIIIMILFAETTVIPVPGEICIVSN